MKRIFALLLTLVLLASSGAALAAGGYTDVPDSHWAAASIQSAKTYGLMSGMTSKTFGLGQTITRAQFVTVTARMLGWDTKTTTASGFTDTRGHWAEGAISAAVQHGALDKGGSFRPDAAISREDMAVILVRALGYQSVAEKAAGYALPFADVKSNKGYVTVAYDIGLTNGVSATQFAPAASATREQAATMLVRIYEIHGQDQLAPRLLCHLVLQSDRPDPEHGRRQPGVEPDDLRRRHRGCAAHDDLRW